MTDLLSCQMMTMQNIHYSPRIDISKPYTHAYTRYFHTTTSSLAISHKRKQPSYSRTLHDFHTHPIFTTYTRSKYVRFIVRLLPEGHRWACRNIDPPRQAQYSRSAPLWHRSPSLKRRQLQHLCVNAGGRQQRPPQRRRPRRPPVLGEQSAASSASTQRIGLGLVRVQRRRLRRVSKTIFIVNEFVLH